MIEIKINGASYKNVSSAEPDIVYDYYYSVQTMDGVVHKKLKGKRTNYTVVFYNVDSEQYEALQSIINSSDTIIAEFPVGAHTAHAGSYYATITSNKIKGYMSNGDNYLTGLTIALEAVNYDE